VFCPAKTLIQSRGFFKNFAGQAALRFGVPVKNVIGVIQEWLAARRPDAGKTLREFSVEFTLTGRNDEYEPHWNERMESVLRYNHALFENSGARFQVAFVEWNPPAGKPLLSPSLVEKYPFVRAIVVAAAVHEKLCETGEISIMLNFGYNAAIRTSAADFVLVSGGDDFLGSDVAQWMMKRGLGIGCLYRAVRVDIRNSLDFENPDAGQLEAPQHAVKVNKVGQAPYTNACGDFILMDRELFQRVRGYDENIRFARSGLDGRCCLSAMALGARCRLIGHVYHIDHSRSYANNPSTYPGKKYDYRAGVPYQNPENWGLKSYTWEQKGDRLFYVR